MTTQTIRQQIISDESVQAIIQKLLDLPERVRDAEDVLAETEFKLSYFNDVKDAKEEVDIIKGEVAYEVNIETEQIENGKDKAGNVTFKSVKKFTNEKQRDAEAMIRLSKDNRYIQACNALKNAEMAKNQLTFDMAKSRNTMLAVKNEYFVTQSIANIIAGLCHENKNIEKLEDLAKLGQVINDICHRKG